MGTFEGVHSAARAAWEQELARIAIQGGTERMADILHGLYHATLAPTLFSDVDGR